MPVGEVVGGIASGIGKVAKGAAYGTYNLVSYTNKGLKVGKDVLHATNQELRAKTKEVSDYFDKQVKKSDVRYKSNKEAISNFFENKKQSRINHTHMKVDNRIDDDILKLAEVVAALDAYVNGLKEHYCNDSDTALFDEHVLKDIDYLMDDVRTLLVDNVSSDANKQKLLDMSDFWREKYEEEFDKDRRGPKYELDYISNDLFAKLAVVQQYQGKRDKTSIKMMEAEDTFARKKYKGMVQDNIDEVQDRIDEKSLLVNEIKEIIDELQISMQDKLKEEREDIDEIEF